MIFDRLTKGKTITTAQELADALQLGYNSAAGVAVTPAEAARFAPVFACIRVLAESMGSMPLNLFKTDGRKKEKARSHPLFDVLHIKPNGYMTSLEWIELITAHLSLRGNHYSWINRVRGEVRELLPLNPDAVSPKLSAIWEPEYPVVFPDGTQRTIPARDILHIRLMSNDGLIGMSPIAQARNSIGLGVAAERFGGKLFKNGSRPSGILTTEKNLDQTQTQLLRDSWEQIQGGENDLRTAILSGGLKWNAISISPDDAQFLETRKYQRSEIAGIFRVPAHMINDLEKATFSNIEHQDIGFVVRSLEPLVRRIEQRISVSLLSSSERTNHYPKFNVNALLRGDMKSRSEYMWRRFQMGSLSPNGIRELEDENPIEGGDSYWVPANMMDLENAETMQPLTGEQTTGEDDA